MHDRKAKMADLADGFAALSCGYGTFEEFCGVMTGIQLRNRTKPCGPYDAPGSLALVRFATKQGLSGDVVIL
jgi:hypothetical protein